MSKKILVMDAAGFVGAPIAKQLQKDGFSVRALIRNADKVSTPNGADQILGKPGTTLEAWLKTQKQA